MPRQPIDTRSAQYHDIETTDCSLMPAKTLSCLTLDSIATDSGLDVFARNRHSQTWMAKIIGSCQQGQISTTNLTCARKYTFEVCRA